MKVLLLCYGGMSTSIMKVKIEEAAKAEGVELEITAKGMDTLEDFKDEYDMFLLGPQVRFMEDEVKEAVGDKPVLVISASDFGMMKGDNVFKQIKEVM